MAKINAVKSLQNHFLIAMPSLQDKYFGRSVTYVLEHNEEGAMGIVINQPLGMTYRDLVAQADANAIVDDEKSSEIVVCGGPVHQDRGFVLHSSQPGWTSSIELNSEIMITTSKDILSVVGNSKGPSNSIIALGYAGWDAGQLEQEIQDNSWLTMELDIDILFNVPIKQKWQAAVEKLGINVWQLSGQSGNA